MYAPGQSFYSPVPQGCSAGLGCAGVGALNMNGTGLLGTGLFAGGTSLANWTWAEYGVCGVAVIVLFSLFSSGQRTAAAVGRYRRKRA